MQDEQKPYRDYDKAWEDHAWEEMRKLLERELPVRRRRRLAAWWIFGAGLAAGLAIATLIFFRLSPNDASAPEGEPPGTEPARPAIAGSPGHAPSTTLDHRTATLPPSANNAAEKRPTPARPMPSEAGSLPVGKKSGTAAGLPHPDATTDEALQAGQPERVMRPAQGLPVQMLAPLASEAPAPAARAVDAPAASPHWISSVTARGGSGSYHVLGIGLGRMRQQPGSAWRWGYAIAWRLRHSRTSGLAVVAFEADLQEQANQFSNRAIAARFRTWHLAEATLFAERRIAPRWALGAGLYTSLLLTTAPTGAGLLQRQPDASVALDSQPGLPGTQTEAELQALINRSVAPLRMGASLHLRYTATPQLDLLLRLRQQLTDDFPRNGLPDRPFALELGLAVRLHPD